MMIDNYKKGKFEGTGHIGILCGSTKKRSLSICADIPISKGTPQEDFVFSAITTIIIIAILDNEGRVGVKYI